MVDEQYEQLQQERTTSIVQPGHATEANPCLDRVQWPELLAGRDMRWDRALGEVIRCARRSLAEERVNIFDIELINLFTERLITGGFALTTKLQEGTYDRDRRVWLKLLCFLLRACEPQIASLPAKGQLAEAERALDRPFEAADLPTTDLCTSPVLHARLQVARLAVPGHGLGFQLTSAQRYWFHQCFWLAYRRHSSGGCDKRHDERSGAVLQRALCRLSICLLDHQLDGRLRESIVVNFLAINGFDEANGTVYGPRAYTLSLSALVKITQLLVIQEGVYLADRGVVSAPVQHLQALRERFLLMTRRTPFMALSAGTSYTVLQFKETTVDIDLFRSFVWRQIDFLRRDLHELLQWEPPGQGPPPPSFALSELRENAANIQVGWSFPQHEANRSQLGPYNRWLLDRVVHTAALRQRWFHKAETAGGVLPRAPAWDARIAALYMKAVKRFMQRLAMLALIMSGQPARGTELLSLRFNNTQIGGCRNIFLVNEQFSFITLYHKGFAMGGTTKLVHRFLPVELNQILVQYLVLVRPFEDHLAQLLHYNPGRLRSAFLWPKRDGTPWETAQISDFLASETTAILGRQARLNISSYRHVAIAISREFIPKGTAHGGHTAEGGYGQLATQGGGQLRSTQERYEQVSRAWMQWFREWREKPVDAADEGITAVSAAATPVVSPAASTIARPAAATNARPAASTIAHPAAATNARPAASTIAYSAAATNARPVASTITYPAAVTNVRPAAATTVRPVAATTPRPAAPSVGSVFDPELNLLQYSITAMQQSQQQYQQQQFTILTEQIMPLLRKRRHEEIDN
ncbi:hypothetical protein MMC21_007518 [Puttea exsequens]|nr:hypothetical protein [Puttea exsequens]